MPFCFDWIVVISYGTNVRDPEQYVRTTDKIERWIDSHNANPSRNAHILICVAHSSNTKIFDRKSRDKRNDDYVHVVRVRLCDT